MDGKYVTPSGSDGAKRHHDGMTLPPPTLVEPMLAVSGSVPEGAEWAYEWKWDGVRAVVAVGSDRVRIAARSGRDVTGAYPELAALPGLVEAPVLLDGELVALGADGRPSFGRLQSRMHELHPTPRLVAEVPVLLFAFDVLRIGGESMLRRPYLERRAALDTLGLTERPVRISPYYTDLPGADMLATAAEHELEGVVAKRIDSVYVPGRRATTWIKTPLWRRQEVVIGGWSVGEGNRARSFGSLLVGVYDDAGRLGYAGRVGSGFDDATLRRLRSLLDPLERPTSPFDQEVPREYARHAHWVAPDLVGEAEFRRWTSDGRLWHPVWSGLRSDREPADIVVPDSERFADA
jgi:bifunctional non-homologous end joining protein LigD